MTHCRSIIAFLVFASAALGQTKSAPNIIVVLADDLGYGDVACLNPEGKIKTPHIDRLAKEGLIFTDAHSGSAVCSPTRYGLLTGRYCWRSKLSSGVLGGLSPRLIEPNRETVASLLKQSKYHTGCIGKWHVGMDWELKPGKTVTELNIESREQVFNVEYTKLIKNGPRAVGFDYYFGISASLDMVPYAFIENDRLTENPIEDRGLPMYANKAKPFTRSGPAAPGFTTEIVLPKLASKAQEYLEERAKSPQVPFFMYVPLTTPHTPIGPNKEFLNASKMNIYADFVMETDAALGKILATLDRLKLAENTLIIFTSDNGCSQLANFPELFRLGHAPSAGYRGAKADIYEGGHHVPFIARWPGTIKPGTTTDQLVCLNDICRTAAEIAGVKVPETAAEDSFSFLPLLQGKKEYPQRRKSIVHHSFDGSFALREGPWKLCFCPGSGGWSYPRPKIDDVSDAPLVQLFNLDLDLGETNNRARSEGERVVQMTKQMEAIIEKGRSTPGPAQQNARKIDLWQAANEAAKPVIKQKKN